MGRLVLTFVEEGTLELNHKSIKRAESMKDLEIVFIDIFWWKMLLMRQLCFYSVLGRTDIITLSLILDNFLNYRVVWGRGGGGRAGYQETKR